MPCLVVWRPTPSFSTLLKLNLFGWVVVDDWRMLTDAWSLKPFLTLIVFCDNVRDLGIILDQELNFSAHINQLTRSCYYQLRQLRTVSRSLSHDAAATLVHAFVTSRLDH